MTRVITVNDVLDGHRVPGPDLTQRLRVGHADQFPGGGVPFRAPGVPFPHQCCSSKWGTDSARRFSPSPTPTTSRGLRKGCDPCGVPMPGTKLGAGWGPRVAGCGSAGRGRGGRCMLGLACRPSSPVYFGPFEAVVKCGAGIPVAGHARCCCERVCQSPD